MLTSLLPPSPWARSVLTHPGDFYAANVRRDGGRENKVWPCPGAAARSPGAGVDAAGAASSLQSLPAPGRSGKGAE